MCLSFEQQLVATQLDLYGIGAVHIIPAFIFPE